MAGARSAALALALGCFCAAAVAAACESPHAAGFRVLDGADGKPIAVWYPSRDDEADAPYGTAANAARGRIAVGGAPAACGPMPLVLFSHGLGGCGLQTLYLTEELARQGYVVAAPDHRDATLCATAPTPGRTSRAAAGTEPSVLEPGRWDDRSYLDRLHDLRAAARAVAADPALGAIVDSARTGAVGHSLGGYTVLGMAGAWRSWREPKVLAVVALSPFVAPYLARRTLGDIGVPVMYQGAVFDWGITPSLEGPNGAYAATPSPKYFVKLPGGTHFEWTNLVCAGRPDTRTCLAARGNAYRINRYAIEFLDRHLKSRPSALLTSRGAGLDTYRFEE